MEQACNETIDILQEVLRNADLYAVAVKDSHDDIKPQATSLSPMEKKLTMVCSQVREHSCVLLERLQQIVASGSQNLCIATPNGINNSNSNATPAIVDTVLFIRKSQLLRERVRRVNSTLSSVKHVGLLNDSSTGRRVITERALTAVKELLELVLRVSATLSVADLMLRPGHGTVKASLQNDEHASNSSYEQNTEDRSVPKLKPIGGSPENFLSCRDSDGLNEPGRSEWCASVREGVSNAVDKHRGMADKTRVAVLSTLFRGSLWKKLLCGENSVNNTTPNGHRQWEGFFARDVCDLFDVDASCVWDVRAVDVITDSEGDNYQRVQFCIRLPGTLDDKEAWEMLQQCEFTRLIAEYARLERQEGPENVSTTSYNEVQAVASEVSQEEFVQINIAVNHGNAFSVDNSRKYIEINDDSSISNFPITLKEEEGSYDSPTAPCGIHHRNVPESALPWRQHHGTDDGRCDADSTAEELFSIHGHLNKLGSSAAHNHISDGVIVKDQIHNGTLMLQKPETLRGEEESVVSNLPLDPSNDISEELPPAPLFSASSPKQVVSSERMDHLPRRQDECNEDATWFSQLPPQPPQRRATASVQSSSKLLTTEHEKVFTGAYWDIVFEEAEDEVVQTFVTETAELFELPKDSVKDVNVYADKKTIKFALVHDCYILEDEINALVSLFDFPRVLKVYKRFVDHCTAEAAAAAAATEDDNSIELSAHGQPSVASKDIASADAASSASWNKDMSCVAPRKGAVNVQLFPDDSSRNNSVDVVEVSSEMAGIDWRQQELYLPLHEDSVTPDNEPATLAHIALLHDVPLDMLIALNPHLASFAADMPLPQSARLHIPRHGSLTEVASMSPSVQSLTPPSRYMKQEMNLRAVAMKLGVPISELRQSNAHLDRYGDTELLPLSCTINVPAILVASADVYGSNSSQASSPHSSPQAASYGRDQRYRAAGDRAQSTDSRSLKSHRTAASNRNSGCSLSRKPPSGRVLGRNDSRSPSPACQSESKRGQRWRAVSASEGWSPGNGAGPLSSTCRSVSSLIENAVSVMSSAVTKFLLLRFFSTWRYFARVKTHRAASRHKHQAISSARKAQAVGGEKKVRPQMSDLRERLRELKRNSGLYAHKSSTSRNVPASLPRRDASAHRSSRAVSPAVASKGRVQAPASVPPSADTAAPASAHVTATRPAPGPATSRASTPTPSPMTASAPIPRPLPTQAVAPVPQQRSRSMRQKEETTRPNSSGRIPPSTSSRLRRMSSEVRFSSPENPLRNEISTSVQHSLGLSHPLRSAPAMRSMGMALPRSPSRDPLLKPVEPVMREWIPIGVVVSPETLIVETNTTTAAACGVERGDRILEIDGRRVHTLRDVQNVLSSGLAPQVFVTVQKSNKAIAAYRVPRFDGYK